MHGNGDVAEPLGERLWGANETGQRSFDSRAETFASARVVALVPDDGRDVLCDGVVVEGDSTPKQTDYASPAGVDQSFTERSAVHVRQTSAGMHANAVRIA
jgi:hypothetical protein